MTCKTCKWAEWQRTANGRINSHRFGTCKYPPLDVGKRPFCEDISIGRFAIWPDNTDDCPTYEKATP